MSEEDKLVVRTHTLERLINILHNSDKSAKKKAFLEIKKEVSSSSGDELLNLYDKLAQVLRISFQDSAEHCREQAIKLTYDFINRLNKDIYYLTSLIPVIHNRICNEEDYEPSEEIRLLHVKLIALLIDKYESDITPYTKDLVEILSALIADEAPHVKKDSCACLIKLVNTAKYEFFEHTKKCVKPLTGNLIHQHWRVRVAAIEALEWAMLRGDHKVIPDVINPLSTRMLDDSPFVRLAIVKLAGHWMLDLADRYSFFAYLVPIILSSFTDDATEVVQEGKTLWPKVGQQFLHENEKDNKDTMNYVPELLEHYPPGVERPGLGCRLLVARELMRFIPAIALELTDWVAKVRVKAALLLAQVTLHSESNITMHIEKIIGAMIKAAMDEELPTVISSVRLAAYYMGFFTPPYIYCNLITNYMKESNPGERRIVASLISGSEREPLSEQLPKMESIISYCSFKGRDQEALLEIISAIFNKCKEDSFVIGNSIFLALITVIGVAENTKIAENAYKLLEEFANFGGGNKMEIYNKYSEQLIDTLKNATWAANCYEQFIFYAVATHAGEMIPDNIDNICEIIKDALSDKSTPEAKLKIYMAVNEIIKDHKNTLPTNAIKEKFSQLMLSNVLPYQLKWYPGRSAEALRTVASTSLYMILTAFGLEMQIPKDMYPLLQSLLEDAAEKTRILSLLCITHICNTEDLHEDMTYESVVHNVLKRLDDCDKKVRELSLNCIQKLYESHIVQKVNNYINMGLLEFTYNTLLIHINDEEKEFRLNVFNVLNAISKLNPRKLRENIQIENFRDKQLITCLIVSTEEQLKHLTVEAKNDRNKRLSESSTISDNCENCNENENETKKEEGEKTSFMSELVNKIDNKDKFDAENSTKSSELIADKLEITSLEQISVENNEEILDEIGEKDSQNK